MANFNHPLLGAAEPGPPQRTPLYGIGVYANGFDIPRPKKLKKAILWLERNGLLRFADELTALAEGGGDLLTHIDEAYKARVDDWTKCGGIFARAANLNPKRLTVTIEATPFTDSFYPADQTFSGIVNDGDRIRIAVAHVHNSGGFLQTYKNLAQWEFGNWMQLNILSRPKSLAEEIGASSPCKK